MKIGQKKLLIYILLPREAQTNLQGSGFAGSFAMIYISHYVQNFLKLSSDCCCVVVQPPPTKKKTDVGAKYCHPFRPISLPSFQANFNALFQANFTPSFRPIQCSLSSQFHCHPFRPFQCSISSLFTNYDQPT